MSDLEVRAGMPLRERGQFDAAGARILVVDDNEPARYALRRTLEREGFAVLEAGDGSTALQRAAEAPELVILDVNLPDMSGFDVCRRLKTAPETRHVPVLQVSATSVDVDSQVVGLEAGADVYLVEPVDRAVLVATVRALLRAGRAERLASQRAAEWRSTFDAIMSPVCLLDAAGVVLRANLAYARLLGRPVTDLVGQPFEESIDPAGAAPGLRRFEALRDGAERQIVEGSVAGRWHQVTFDPRHDEHGRFVGAAVTLTDLEDRRRAEVSLAEALSLQRRLYDSAQSARRLLEEVVRQLPVALIVVEAPSGRVVVGNDQVERILRAPVPPAGESLLAVDWPSFHADGRPYAPEERPLARSLAAGEIVTDEEMEVARDDGSRVVISVSSGPVRDEHAAVVAAVVTFADVTARRQAEALRETFIGVLSHELRTPVTTIYAGAEILLRRGSTVAPEVREELLADVASEADRLQHLVENLLVFARVERGVASAEREPVLLHRLIERLLADETRRWPSTRFALQAAPHLPAVAGDERLIELALRNLLSNAAKYGPPEGEVEVVVESSGPAEVAVRVLDRGPGIPADAEANLFRAFYRATETAHAAPGAGIGLFVVRSLVDEMAGRVWAAPRLGGGAEFGLALPTFEE